MVLGKIVKQPVEKRNYFVKYDDYLQSGETVTAAVAKIDTGSSIVVIPPVIMAGGTTIEFWLEGGLDGEQVKLEITATTNRGNIQQDELKIKVKEI